MSRPDDGNFAGIDPQLLNDMIVSLSAKTADSGDAATQANIWMRKATRCGIDTTLLRSISGHLAWGKDQLPMLNRRLHLAQDAANQQSDFISGAPGMVTAGATSLGAFSTSDAAVAAANADAKAFKDGDLSAADFYKKLEAEQGDPDYSKALTQALGADQIGELEREIPYDPNDPKGDQPRSALAAIVASAMRQGIRFPVDPQHPKLQNLDILDPLVAYGGFPADVLVQLGYQTLTGPNQAQSVAGPVLQALSQDPKAAAQFLAGFQGTTGIPIGKYIQTGSDHSGMMSPDNAQLWANVIHAGTIDAQGTDSNDAAKAASDLISYYAKNPDNHTYGPIQTSFGQIVESYWPDAQAAITDPAPANLGAGHINLTGAQWQSFIGEAMRDPKTAAGLMAFSKGQATELQNANPNNPEALYAAGLIEGYFRFEVQSVYAALKKEDADAATKWNGTLQGQLTTIANTTFDLVLKPENIASTILKTGAKDAIGLFIKDVANVDAGGVPKPPASVTWQDEWTASAATAYQQNHGQYTPVKDGDITWTGDPQQYANWYSGGKPFLNPDGTLVANSTDQQKYAYNQWLKDPAVAQSTYKIFQATNQGFLNGSTGGT